MFWQQTQVSQSAAAIDFTAEISNGTKNNQARRLVVKILDAKGKVVATESQVITIPGLVAPTFIFNSR